MKVAQAKARITLKNILFATDFSPSADAAAPFAIQIAKSYGSKVYGAHVDALDTYVAATPEGWATMVEAEEIGTADQTERLNGQLSGVEHEVLIEKGNASQVICDLARQKEIDLIVLGTRGRTGLGKALLGSVAEQILRQAPCPVLTVGPHVTLQPEKAAHLKEILFATNLSTEFPPAAPYAISLAQENQARLTLLHVIENQKTEELLHASDVADFKLRKLDQLVPLEAKLGCAPRCMVEQGIAAEKILEAADGGRADLIVLGAQPAKWLSTHFNAGTVHKVIAEAKCPVLTVHG